jgi:putative flippase GtrA
MSGMATIRAMSGARLMRFAFVGVLGTLAYYAVLSVLVEACGLPVMLSTSIAFVVVTVENYLLHRGWTFRSEAAHGEALPRFLLMCAAGFGINWMLMSIGIRLGFHYLLVQGAAIAAIVAWNFAVSSYWIFGNRKS